MNMVPFKIYYLYSYGFLSKTHGAVGDRVDI